MTYPSEPPTPPILQPPSKPTPPQWVQAPTPPADDPAPIRWGMGDVMIGIALWIIGGVVGAFVLLATGGSEQLSLTELSLGAIAISLMGGWLGFLGWPIVATYWKGQRSLSRDYGLWFRPIDLAWGLLGGLAALVLSVVGGVLWTLLSSEDSPSNAEFLPSSPSAGTAIALLLLVAVGTPIVEELFFRGLFLRAVGRRWNLTVGVLLSSVVFGMMHAQGDSWAELLFLVGMTGSFGVVFALLVVQARGRLGSAIVAHMCVNAVGVLGALYL
jgi:membrane protease YdiL (CAAX protease family)